MRSRSSPRVLLSLALSLFLNLLLVAHLQDALRFDLSLPDATGPAPVRLERFLAKPLPRPATPPPHWQRLDRSSVRYAKVFPDRLQIVLLAAKRSDGTPSDAPNIYRVDIRPARIRANTVMHIRVFASPDADGVYLRFAVWEIAASPVGTGRFPASDPDFAGKPFERFERDYVMPPIPPLFANRSYEVQVAVVGRSGLASGAFVSLYLEGSAQRQPAYPTPAANAVQ